MTSAPETRPAERARFRPALALALLVVALAPSLGTVAAPWIAEDAAILARVQQDGAWADWTRPWFGLELVRFWRPVVSASWALQEDVTGIAPVPLRLFNLGLHAAVTLLAAALLLRGGARPWGAFVAGAWIALFPEQGGTSTWLAGRTDLLAAALLAASVLAALGERPARGRAGLGSALLAFLACAAKEFGFLAPAWVFALARARGEPARAALARALPALIGVGVALAWRSAALGELVGGYPAPHVAPLAGAAGAATALADSAWPSLVALAALLALGACAGRLSGRLAAGALAAAVLALVPLWPLLSDGLLEPQNRRLLYVPELAFALAAGAAWARGPGTAHMPLRTRALAAVTLVALGVRGSLAWRDTHDWARAARAGEDLVAAARASVADARPGEAPVLFAGFPESLHGAYCLGFGLPARFREPFPVTPRPVWPWRLLFAHDAARERRPLVAPRADGSIRPLDDTALVPRLAVRDADGAPVHTVRIERSAVLAPVDLSPRLVLVGPPGAPVEGVVFTELGYEPLPLTVLDAGGHGTFSLMQLLATSAGAAAGAEVLAHVADLGATRAMLELRAYGPDGEVCAASRWIEVTWPHELLALARSDQGRAP